MNRIKVITNSACLFAIFKFFSEMKMTIASLLAMFVFSAELCCFHLQHNFGEIHDVD